MLKTISAIMTVIFMSMAVVGENVSAEEYEKNIVLTCESKDIDINEIPEDRTVDLLVSIENNPGFIVLGLTFDFDKRLSYPDWAYYRFLDSKYENRNDNFKDKHVKDEVLEQSESKTEERIEALPVTSVTSFPVTTSEVSEIKKEITTLSVKTVETSSQVTSVASSAKASVTEIVTEEYKNIEY